MSVLSNLMKRQRLFGTSAPKASRHMGRLGRIRLSVCQRCMSQCSRAINARNLDASSIMVGTGYALRNKSAVPSLVREFSLGALASWAHPLETRPCLVGVQYQGALSHSRNSWKTCLSNP